MYQKVELVLAIPYVAVFFAMLYSLVTKHAKNLVICECSCIIDLRKWGFTHSRNVLLMRHMF